MTRPPATATLDGRVVTLHDDGQLRGDPDMIEQMVAFADATQEYGFSPFQPFPTGPVDLSTRWGFYLAAAYELEAEVTGAGPEDAPEADTSDDPPDAIY